MHAVKEQLHAAPGQLIPRSPVSKSDGGVGTYRSFLTRSDRGAFLWAASRLWSELGVEIEYGEKTFIDNVGDGSISSSGCVTELPVKGPGSCPVTSQSDGG